MRKPAPVGGRAHGPCLRSAPLALTAFLMSVVPAIAQHEHHQTPPDQGWGWAAESSMFLTGNIQERKFRDFHQVESQNWIMGVASHRIGAGGLTLHGMLSFEPFTLRDLGSSQVFQTGETFDGAPLIDYQHPHDLIMGLSAAYERPIARATLQLRGGLVDEPALGPTAFMHRASANLHPTAPLSHHQLDSTHITQGAVTAGVRVSAWQLETSAFRGREPDEDRTDLDLGPLDSYSLRGSWIRGRHARAGVGRVARRAARHRAWRRDPHHRIGRAPGRVLGARRSGDVGLGSKPPPRKQRDGLVVRGDASTLESRHRLPARRARRQTYPRRRRRPPAGRCTTHTSSRVLARSLLATPTNCGAM